MAREMRRAPEALSVWQSNMKELEASQPNLAVMLYDYVKEHGHDFEHYENITPAGKWVEGLADEPFFERNDEPKFNWNKKKRADKNKPVFMLYGVGTPPYLFKAIRALPDAAMAFIVMEPSLALLAYTLHLTNVYLAMPKGCRLVFLTEGVAKGEAEHERWESKFLHFQLLKDECLHYSLTPIGIYAAALSELSAHPGEHDVWRDKFSEFSEGIKEWVRVNLSYLGNSAEDTLLGFRQVALMSHYIAFGAPLELISKKFAGRPAVAVAAGPSLDKNFMLLKDIQDKCVIIAADTILAKLLSNGIKPHIVTSLERGTLTYELYFSKVVDEYGDECKDILLVAQALCEPTTPGRWPGPVCIAHKRELVIDRWFAGGVLGGSPLHSGLSVAHMNYSLADYIDAPAIAIIGQDLAYSDDGMSHAGGVNGSWKMGPNDEPFIRGALGGFVKTNGIWISFLRFLESQIRVFRRPTWDCTEGGAFIASTKVLPFADFIEEQRIRQLDPIENTPAEMVREGYGDVDFGGIRERVLDRIGKQYAQFDMFDKHLDEVEKLMEHTVAAGLEPSRRIGYARKAGQKLDFIHSRSPVFDFIGQSYTRLASIELSLTRSLDEVETIKRWHAMHKEIVDSHRALVSFVRRWTSHAERLVDYWGSRGNPDFSPLSPDEAWESAGRLLAELRDAEGEDIAPLRMELDNLMIRCDPVLLKWPGCVLWSFSMLLMQEGRAALATRYMKAAAEDFDGKEMPVDEMGAFFKDYARVLMGYDLTHTPDLFNAEVMLSNAAELIGIDDEAREIMSELLDAEVAHHVVVDDLMGRKKEISATAGWFQDRAVAQRQLYEGDLKRAVASVWRAISKHWNVVPGWAASHLDWLAQTIEKCMGVDDPLLAEAIDRIMSEMAVSEELFMAIRFPFPMGFIRELKRRGLVAPLLVKKDVPENAEESDDVVSSGGETAEFAEMKEGAE